MEDELFEQKKIQVFIKRDDLIHPIVSGNKWRKLKEYLLIAQKEQVKGIISFGGAYSNHIYALAFVCKELEIPLHLIIRGEELSAHSNQYLSEINSWGIHLHFISREAYRNKNIPNEINQIDHLIIPEGGFSKMGIESMKGLSSELKDPFDYIFTAVGTGTSLIGLAQYLPKSIICGILSLSNKLEIEKNINDFHSNMANLILFDQFIEKKYGKKNTELEEFCIQFKKKHKISIEPIYTGLLLKSFYQLVEENYFQPNNKILIYHSGGIK